MGIRARYYKRVQIISDLVTSCFVSGLEALVEGRVDNVQTLGLAIARQITGLTEVEFDDMAAASTA